MDDFALQGAGILIFVHQHVIEILGEALSQRRGLHHDVPVQQQVIEIQNAILLFTRHILAIQFGEIRFPLLAPGKLLLERLLQRQLGIDAIGIDGEAHIFAREALFLVRIAQIVTHHIHDVGGIGSVQDGECRIKPQMFGIQPQNAVAHRMKGTGPEQPVHHAAIARLAAIRHHLRDNVLGTANHFLRRSARKGQHQDARGIDTIDHQVRGSMGQGVGLARAGTGENQQRTTVHALAGHHGAEGGSALLRGIQRVKCSGLGFHHGGMGTVRISRIHGKCKTSRQDRAIAGPRAWSQITQALR